MNRQSLDNGGRIDLDRRNALAQEYEDGLCESCRLATLLERAEKAEALIERAQSLAEEAWSEYAYAQEQADQADEALADEVLAASVWASVAATKI